MKDPNITTLNPPFIKSADTVGKIMSDLVLALFPCIIISYFTFGLCPILVIMASVGSAVVSEFIFSSLFLHKRDSIFDGSCVVTGILLALTLAPFTPVYIAAFGAACAVIFGKLLWGGLGRNLFNPALVGREFMAAFFPAVMVSRGIWYNNNFHETVSIKPFNVLGSGTLTDYLNFLSFKPSGAIGEYSILLLILGGLFLLLKKRISWQIIFPLLTIFSLLTWIVKKEITFSLGGLILGAVFMATDMPSSATTKGGKIYYGLMIGITAVLFIANNIRYEYMSYSILLINGFSRIINKKFPPKVWGETVDYKKTVWNTLLLTILILICTLLIILLYKYDAIKYLVFLYIAGCIIHFNTKILV